MPALESTGFPYYVFVIMLSYKCHIRCVLCVGKRILIRILGAAHGASKVASQQECCGEKIVENCALCAGALPATSATMAVMAPAHLAALFSKEANAGHDQWAASAHCVE